MSLELAHKELGWPSPDDILRPQGAGPRVYAQLAERKLGTVIQQYQDAGGVKVGVLTRNPSGHATEDPLAVVCEFPRTICTDTLRKVHQLAWSFCRAPLLITLEPNLVRAWSCYEVPAASTDTTTKGPVVESTLQTGLFDRPSISEQAAQSLRWVELLSGRFFHKHERRFQNSKRADRMLLENLKELRNRLTSRQPSLTEDVAHPLIARLIFIQFLFQRKDSVGQPALHKEKLRDLYEAQTLCARYDSLEEILRNHADTYRLFRWLNNVFNGDLFPGQADTPEEREAEWEQEMSAVRPQHLELLSDFVSGEMQMASGQRSLWPMYCFDAIPLEFISSIYEEFVKKATGVHYTPSHLVDFILDSALPWAGTEWDVKILDPACGSGIFLVKAYQRLIHRWKNANPRETPKPAQLRKLIERNLRGVDIDGDAVRVASFSVYLAMCDEIDPRRYWTEVRFPRLRDRQLIKADFFDEDVAGFRTEQDSQTYDLVIGNAPWGKDTMSPAALDWQKRYNWPVANKEIGPLFLAKASHLCKSEGQVAMLQPAGALLFNRESTALQVRKTVFSRFNVERVVNLSALRFATFHEAAGPACIIVLKPGEPDGSPLLYCCPKRTCTWEDHFRIMMDPYDAHDIHPCDAANDPTIWSVLAWGGARDLSLVRRLSQYSSIAKAKTKHRAGVDRGRKRRRPQEAIVDRRYLAESEFPNETFLHLRADGLPINRDPATHYRDSTDFSAFELPQLLVKLGWRKSADSRFRAAIVESSVDTGPVICSKRYVSVHSDDAEVLEAACLSYNSWLAVYFLFLASGRCASYRPEALVEDVITVPIPEPKPGLLEGLRTFQDIDARTREAFGLKDAEWDLIEDLCRYTIPDFHGNKHSAGRQSTRPESAGNGDEPFLTAYSESFQRVLKSGFGEDKAVCATIFQEPGHPFLPLRLVAIHLDWPGRGAVEVETVDSAVLLRRLADLNSQFLGTHGPERGGIFYQRVARVYDTVDAEARKVPTVYLVKPDQRRYWTRSMALRDADEVAADVMLWHDESGTGGEVLRA